MQYDTYIYLTLRDAEKEAALPQNWVSDEDMRAHTKTLLAELGEPDLPPDAVQQTRF